ncbi:SUN domain-containing ossification factor isoform X2 [Genypterus blacodes]|uniref:SUN domain-containing ossification factor isoform X2 n=1 Tax=Genypterus blacodes TaxID=154954 RepID=UPI003F7754FE
MMMTPLLWRVVSLWLIVAVLCWYPSHAGSTESHQEAQSLVSPQDISSEEEPGENTLHHKVDDSLVLDIQSLSEDDQLVENDDQEDAAPTTWEAEEEKHSQLNIPLIIHQPLDMEEPNVEVRLEEEERVSPPQTKHEHGSENPHQEASVTQDQDSASSSSEVPPPSPEPEPEPVTDSAANLEDDLSTFTFQEDAPNSVSDDVISDVPAPEVGDAYLPPPDCEEEEEGEGDNPYDTASGPPVVLENISNAHTAGTKSHTDPPLSSQSGHSSPHLKVNTSHMLKEQDLSPPAATEPDSSVSSKDPEDIPTFDEWKRKMMEVEKEKTHSTHTSANGGSHTVKKAQKNFNNYASVECGAKILGSNPEAKSTSAILMENMDVYMLNPCSNKIWFIIELCEPIQVKQLDIANFELFSSTPKDFLVSISDRYPTNKWLKLGTFHGRDERTVQSFPLDEHLYAKYVKVELLSHFGSEHFCPLSLLRVFGTSMVEEYEEIVDPSERPDDQDDELDYPPGFVLGEAKYPKNLIGSAKDVILNMVNNIAVNVLGGGPEMQGNISSQEVNVTELSSQLQTTTETTATHLPPVTEDVEKLLDAELAEIATPSPETATSETLNTDANILEVLPVEEKIVVRLERDEDEHIGPTVTLLDEEEELDEAREIKQQLDRQQESLDYCELSSSPQSSLCCCSASLQELLQRRCLARLSKTRNGCNVDREQTLPSQSQTPTMPLPLSPSTSPEPPHHRSEMYPPQDKEPAPEESESEAKPSDPPNPPGNAVESQKEEMMAELPVLEPSQTPTPPKASATDSFTTKATATVEPPQLSSEDPHKELTASKSQDTLAEEKHEEQSASLSPIFTVSSVSATMEDPSMTAAEEKHSSDAPTQTPHTTDQSQLLHSSVAHSEHQPTPPAALENGTAETSHPSPDATPELEPSLGHAVLTDVRAEDLGEDGGASLPHPSSAASPSHSDFYAEVPGSVEQNGNQVHGTNQKESVFMRLNNRIKALEMNMSLSGRYLEQLSQRYRRQMEEMQKAFNKTIIKLQNTSRIAEAQDQRQTESIQALQGHLENVTQLVLNLSVRVSQLQSEVSDRQSYLLLSLMLCLFLGLMLCANHCRFSTLPSATEPEPPMHKSYSFCCPERQFSCCDETSLKRSASYPLINSESFQLDTSEGSGILQTEDTQSLCPANKKRRRHKIKPSEKVETLKPSLHAAPELSNGGVVCNGAAVTANPYALTKTLLQPTFRDSPSEGSSEGSSHSDDPSFCGITAGCTRICDGLPAPKTRAEKRALRRRRPKPSFVVVDSLQVPLRDKSESLPIATVQDLMNRRT